MSIPKGKTSCFGRFDDPEKLHMIAQNGVRLRLDPADLGYSSCWDLNYSPYNGKIYFAPCHEDGTGAQTRLVSYDFEKDESKIELKLESLTLPKSRQMPHTKLHESITFMPDGKLLATTHSTDRAPQQPEWMPFAHVDHVWEGYPGSYIIQFDPETGDARNLGMPAPRESIYGGTYVAAREALYMIGFMRGHCYRYSFKDQTVKDMGKAAEVFCYRLHEGPDHNVYGMTKSGFLFRINTEIDELEDLNWRLPANDGDYVNNTWYRYMNQGVNVSDHEFLFTACDAQDMFMFDTDTLQVHSIGKRCPYDSGHDFQYKALGLSEFGVDRDGVLWYIGRFDPDEPPTDEFYHVKTPCVMIRWDYRHGKAPEYLGIVATPEAYTCCMMCITVDPIRNRLFGICNAVPTGETKSKLAVLAIDLDEYQPHREERGAICTGLNPVPYTEEEIAAVKKQEKEGAKWVGEEVSADNPFQAAPIPNVIPLRLWRAVPYTEIPESKVQGLVWDDEGNVHGICGDKKKYYFRIVPRPTETFASKEEADANDDVKVWRSILKKRGNERMEDGIYKVDAPTSFSYKIAEVKPYDELCECCRQWLEENMRPGKPERLPEGIKLPEVSGRRYLAVATATVKLADGRIAVGTKDGLFCLIKNGKVFSMGSAAPMGPIRCLCTAPDGMTVYGTCGDDEDMGTIFKYDDENGLTQIGLINYNSHGWMDGPTAANVLSSIAVSPDGKMLAVGGADRIGSVHILIL